MRQRSSKAESAEGRKPKFTPHGSKDDAQAKREQWNKRRMAFDADRERASFNRSVRNKSISIVDLMRG